MCSSVLTCWHLVFGDWCLVLGQFVKSLPSAAVLERGIRLRISSAQVMSVLRAAVMMCYTVSTPTGGPVVYYMVSYAWPSGKTLGVCRSLTAIDRVVPSHDLMDTRGYYISGGRLHYFEHSPPVDLPLELGSTEQHEVLARAKLSPDFDRLILTAQRVMTDRAELMHAAAPAVVAPVAVDPLMRIVSTGPTHEITFAEDVRSVSYIQCEEQLIVLDRYVRRTRRPLPLPLPPPLPRPLPHRTGLTVHCALGTVCWTEAVVCMCWTFRTRRNGNSRLRAYRALQYRPAASPPPPPPSVDVKSPLSVSGEPESDSYGVVYDPDLIKVTDERLVIIARIGFNVQRPTTHSKTDTLKSERAESWHESWRDVSIATAKSAKSQSGDRSQPSHPAKMIFVRLP